jgi:hypothetical protein
MTWLVSGILAIAFYFVFRRSPLIQRLSPERGAILTALVAIAIITRSLVTEPLEGPWFGLRSALLGGAMTVLIVVATRRLRRS